MDMVFYATTGTRSRVHTTRHFRQFPKAVYPAVPILFTATGILTPTTVYTSTPDKPENGRTYSTKGGRNISS